MWLKSFWKAILWAAIVFYLCTIPGNDVDKVRLVNIPHLDKVVHFMFYFILSILLLSGFDKLAGGREFKRRYYLYTICFSVLYGVIIEILQEFVFTGRSFEMLDIAANCTGVATAVISYSRIVKIGIVKKLL